MSKINMKWQVMKNVDFYQIWRLTRKPDIGEPMHSGLREVEGYFATREEAQAEADRLNTAMDKAV